MSDLIKREDAIKAINKALDRETLLYGLVRKIAVDAIRSKTSGNSRHWNYIKGKSGERASFGCKRGDGEEAVATCGRR